MFCLRELHNKRIGICSTVFKDRYRNHTKSFNNERYKTETELSKEVVALKDKNGTPKISWSIYGRFSPYNPESKRCDLCLNKKVEITMHKENNILKKRCELVSKCHHQNKYKLSNLMSFCWGDNIT